MTKALIVENIKVGPGYYHLLLKTEKEIVSGKPGQFLNLKVNSQNVFYDPLLRRPLSIFDINSYEKTVSIVYKVAGRGTKLLSSFKKGAKIDFLGPLGNGFTTDFKEKNLLIIGGGIGAAPLYYLARVLSTKNKVTVLLGGNTGDEMLFFQKKFRKFPLQLKIATMDGTMGFKGSALDLLKDYFKNKKAQIDYLFTCGPEPMLKELQKICAREKIASEAAMEERMGCGIGVCLSCICKTKEGNKRLCTEGPVLPLGEVVFDA